MLYIRIVKIRRLIHNLKIARGGGAPAHVQGRAFFLSSGLEYYLPSSVHYIRLGGLVSHLYLAK